MKSAKINKRRGVAMVEFALTSLLLFLLLVVVFDFGLYAHAFISIQNAARVAALRNSGGLESASDQSGACSLAASELRSLPNIGASFAGDCSSVPLVVSSVLCESSNPCTPYTVSADGYPAVKVTVTYKMPLVFVLHKVLPIEISRTAQAKVRNVS